MEHSILIQDFFDGRIDEAKEDDLFQLMSMNRDIRKEFKNHLTIESALKNDSRKLLPMASTTLGVFSRIGYQFPSDSIPTSTQNAAAAGKQGFLAKYSHSIYTGFATALITTIVFLLIMNMNPESSIIQSSTVMAGKPEIKIDDNIKANKNSINSAQTLASEKPVKYIYITKHDTVIANEIKLEENETPAPASLSESRNFNSGGNPGKRLKSAPAAFSRINDNQAIVEEQAGLLRFETDNKDKQVFSVGISCFQDWPLNGQAVREAYLPTFNNWGISAFYLLNSVFSIGFDLRKEFFNQIYNGIDQAGDEFIYKQNTNYMSFGLTGKYKFYNFNAFDSFAQLTVGGNMAGPLVRLQAGLDYRPVLNNTYYLGVEGSVLNFYHNNKTFYSPKIGVTIGTSFGF